MEELRKRLDIAERAFFTLQESLDSPFGAIVRDPCLLRFAYTYDCCWKLLMIRQKVDGGRNSRYML